MTPRREDPGRGFGPDSCFYVRNEGSVSGDSQVDLGNDPPPDLVVEADIASPTPNKLPVYAQIGAPEVWRYDGGRLGILRLERTANAAVPNSAVLTGPLAESKATRRRAWMRGAREWARNHARPPK